MAGRPPAPPRAPGGPPKPPPRRPAQEQVVSRVISSAPENPFIVAPDPTPELPVANPFLSPEPAPQPVEAARSAPVQQQVAPLRSQPGAVAPIVKDPHAEFRRGGFLKSALIVGAAAAVVAGLFFLLPVEAERVIGTSVSPDVIADPNKASLTNPHPLAVKPSAPEEPEAPPSPGPSGSGNFAESFKSAAR